MVPAQCESLTVDESRAKLRELLADSVPIAASHVGLVPGTTMPLAFVQLATRGRPDLADLIRVHALEPTPEGDVEAQWILAGLDASGPGWTFLSIELQRPARADILLAFRLTAHRHLLEAVAATGLLGLAFKPVHWERPDLIRADLLIVQVPTWHIRYALSGYTVAAAAW